MRWCERCCINGRKFPNFFFSTFKIFILFHFNFILDNYRQQIAFLALSKTFSLAVLGQNITAFYIISTNQICCSLRAVELSCITIVIQNWGSLCLYYRTCKNNSWLLKLSVMILSTLSKLERRWHQYWTKHSC